MFSLTIRRPDDMHVHLRDGDYLPDYVRYTAAQFARAIVMPNLKPPITTVDQAALYSQRIRACAPDFTPLMTLYLTDSTPTSEIRRAKDSNFIHGVKLYPAGATTNSDAGVTSLEKVHPVLRVMEEVGMPLLVHGEVTGDDVDIFDREDQFLEDLEDLLRAFPKLRVVLEHITTASAAHFVRAQPVWVNIAATITAHHLLENRNAIFRGGINPHNYCLPILKREEDRRALLEAATSGEGRFFAGTDSAPHQRQTKENSCGCAGCFTAANALELYATAFDSVGKLDRMEGFLSENGARFYGLPLNEGTVRLVRQESEILTTVPLRGSHPDADPFIPTVVPFWAGKKLSWVVER